MFQDFRYSDTTHLSRSVKVLKLKNFKKDATLKLFKNDAQDHNVKYKFKEQAQSKKSMITTTYSQEKVKSAYVGMRLKAEYAADMGETIYVVESFPEYNVLGTVFEAHIVKRLSLAFVDGHCIASLDWELQARMAILIKPSSCGGIPGKFKVTTSPGNFLNMNSLIASAFSFLGVRIALSLRNFSGMSIHVGSSSPSLIFAGSVLFLTAKTHWLNSCFAVSIPPFGEYSLTLMLRVSVNTLQYLYSLNLFMQAWTTSGLLAFGITGKICLKSPPSNTVIPPKFCFLLSESLNPNISLKVIFKALK
ncbi:hypothetical protein Tco_0686361 [Tanacetum coccineum]